MPPSPKQKSWRIADSVVLSAFFQDDGATCRAEDEEMQLDLKQIASNGHLREFIPLIVFIIGLIGLFIPYLGIVRISQVNLAGPGGPYFTAFVDPILISLPYHYSASISNIQTTKK